MLDFRIKICGITSVDDGRAVVDSGGDAIGLNFYQQSPRFVSVELAARIAEAVRPVAKVVGLFVNDSWTLISKMHSIVQFDYIQLHGDETPSQCVDFCDMPPLIRALRWPPRSKADNDFVTKWTLQEHTTTLRAYLADANMAGAYGGTGALTDWPSLFPRPKQLQAIPLILAGGLNSTNVANGIKVTRPDAVDTASGVESMPGKKDLSKLKHFVDAARDAFEQL